MPKPDVQKCLFNIQTKPESISTEQRELIFEQYKLYVEMTDRISARRITANSFFLSVNTAVVSILGIGKSLVEPNSIAILLRFLVPVGIVLSYFWYRLIKSYRDLATAKFEVIHAMEKYLLAAPYTAEWECVGEGKKPKSYWPMTHIEIAIPWIFILGYVIALVFVFGWVNFPCKSSVPPMAIYQPLSKPSIP